MTSPVIVILLGFALFLLVGIYVVSGQWEAARPARDAKALERWRKTQQLGFWLFAVRGPIPWVFVCIFGRELLHAWRYGASLVPPKEEVVSNAFLSLILGLVLSALQWRWLRAEAAEVIDRAKRAQDARSA